MIYNPYSYQKNQQKENWGAVFGMFVLPVLLVLLGFALFKTVNKTFSLAAMRYQNGGFISSGTQIGVGGAPPTMTPLRQNDLLVQSSDFTKGSSYGFISKNAYEDGARVYFSAQMTYQQECSKDGKTVKENQNIVINKGADSYSTEINNINGSEGYLWTVSFDASNPTNLCPLGYTASTISQIKQGGRVFLSKDGGVTQVTDPNSHIPIQIGLTP